MLAAADFAVTEGQALHCVAEIGDCDGMSNLAAVTLRLPIPVKQPKGDSKFSEAEVAVTVTFLVN